MEEIIKISDENGKEKEYSILATFEYKNRDFMIYTDYQVDENKKVKIYSAIYNKNGQIKHLEKIKEPDDINVVNNFIKDLEKKVFSKK